MEMGYRLFGYLSILAMMMGACGEDYVPKPKAFLRLEYPKAYYKRTTLPKIPASFEINNLVESVSVKNIQSTTSSYGANLDYKPLKATIFLTYKAIDGNEKNLRDFLRDAQKLTLEHTRKADEIPRYPYENQQQKVYGMLSEVKGNAASPAQFYVTDSVNHFLTGSLYFYAKPNYDSIFPAAKYLQKDIRHLMETLEWE